LEQGAGDGLDVKGHGIDVSASRGVVETVLEWAHNNPLLFIACLLLIGWAFWLNHRTNVAKNTQRIEYDERRTKIRLSARDPELLPEEPQKEDEP